MEHDFNHNERGQNLVLIAVIMVVLIALAALAIDGGFALSNRRKAQNAADAGALAGANMLCAINPSVSPYDAAWNYAVVRNGAQDADITVNSQAKTITVNTTIPHNTFLAGIFGSDVITSNATAAAGCYGACNAITMPVAWACHPPVEGMPDPNCTIQYGTDTDPGPTYVIMDTNKTPLDYACISMGGSLNCDINGDGQDEYIAGGARSWLDLNGESMGKDDLRDWVYGSKTETISQHMWLPGTGGVATDIFHAAQARLDENRPYVIVPIFDDYTVTCEPDLLTGSCHSQWHTGIDQIRPANNGPNADYYHIISFSLFKITCVSTNQGHKCDGKQFYVKNGILTNSDKTIEGYFLTGYVPGTSGRCDYNAGAYTIYLDH